MKRYSLFVTGGLVFLTVMCSNRQHLSYKDIDQFKSLPYVTWSSDNADEDKIGVVRYIPEKASPGYNLFFNLKDRAYLTDMEGIIVHTWFMPYYTGKWEYGIIKKNGNLVAYCIDLGIVELDWYSKPP